MIEEFEYHNEKDVFLSYKYKYDEFTNVTEHICYNSNGGVFYRNTIKYSEFDNENNWLKKVEYHKNIPAEISIRIIEYYN
ncbi:MAG: hypothetical protein DRI86_14280 [Bacteroidetes bacterium]|nr:MAG: hypothetical protein DRI86_14280 [Bacteroidota bacterium]